MNPSQSSRIELLTAVRDAPKKDGWYKLDLDEEERDYLLSVLSVQSETRAKGWAIRHVDGRWRTMDTIGMPDFTDDPAKALVCRLREHVDAYAADDPEDVRIVEVDW